MAIMRCNNHKPKGRTRSYVVTVEPIGYPDTALICGSAECKEPGLIWLEAHEKTAYDRGERIFKSFTETMKVRAT
jgi:hypothetical protein